MGQHERIDLANTCRIAGICGREGNLVVLERTGIDDSLAPADQQSVLTVRQQHLHDARASIAAGRSVVLWGEPGSGSSAVSAALVRELRENGLVVRVKPGASLAAAMDTARSDHGNVARPMRGRSPIVLIDVADDLPAATLDEIVVAARAGELIVLARVDSRPLDGRGTARRPLTDLWTWGIADRIDFRPLSEAEACDYLDTIPGARTLDRGTRAVIRDLASGSPSLLGELVESTLALPPLDPMTLAGLEPVAPPERIATLIEHRVAGFDDMHRDALTILNRLGVMESGRARELLGAGVFSSLERAGNLISLDGGMVAVRAIDALAARARPAAGPTGLAERVVASLLDQHADGIGLSDIEMLFVASHLEDGGPDALSAALDDQGADILSEVFRHGARKANAAALPWRALAFSRRVAEMGDREAAAVESAIALASIGRDRSARDTAMQVKTAAGDEQESFDRIARIATLLQKVSPDDADNYVETAITALGFASDTTPGAISARLAALEFTVQWDRLEAARTLAEDRSADLASRLRALGAMSSAAGARGDGEALDAALRISGELLRSARSSAGLVDAEIGTAEVDAVFSLVIALASTGFRHDRLGALAEDLQTAVLRRHDVLLLSRVAAINAFVAASRGDYDGTAIELDAALRRHVGSDPGWIGWLHAIRATVSLRQGDFVEARRLIDSALTDTPAGSWWRHSAETIGGYVLLAEGRGEEAREKALDLADRIGDAPYLEAYNLFDAVLFGEDPARIVGRMRDLASRADVPSVQAMADGLTAFVQEDLDGLDTAAAQLGSMRLLMQAEFLAAESLRHRSSRGERRVGPTRSLLSAIRRDMGRGVDTDGPHLTEREREVAELVAQGLTNRAVATRLYLSVRTVESHVYQALAKLGGTSRREMADLLAVHTVTETTPGAPSSI